MYTVVELPTFKNKIDKLFTAEERLEFVSYLSANPDKGDVIKGGKGLRKIRWSRQAGKSGGVRVIYYNMLDDGYVFCLDVYAKSQKENVSASELKQLSGMKK